MDAAKCVEGKCTLVKLSAEEKQKRDEAIKAAIEKMQKEQGEQKSAQPGQGGQPQKPGSMLPQPPRQGYPGRQGAYPDRSSGYGG